MSMRRILLGSKREPDIYMNPRRQQIRLLTTHSLGAEVMLLCVVKRPTDEKTQPAPTKGS